MSRRFSKHAAFPSSCSSYNIDHALHLADLIHQIAQGIPAGNLKFISDRCCPALAHTRRHAAHINVALREDLGDIHQKAGTVVGKDADLSEVQLSILSVILQRPLRLFDVDQSCLLFFRQTGHINTVLSVNGNASSPGDKTDDIVARDRTAAL